MKDVSSVTRPTFETSGRPLPSLTWRCAIALLAVTAALLLRWILRPVLHDNFPFITLYGAAALAVWYSRWRLAVVASLLGYVIARYLFISPENSAALTVGGEIAALIAYSLSCGFIIYFGERLHRSSEQLLQLFASTNFLEDTLSKEKELLATTLASIGDAVIVTDDQGRVTFINSEAERLIGWKSSEVIQKPLSDVFRIIDERTRQPAENPVKKALREGVIVGLANHTVLISRDGREIPIDDSAAPIRKHDGPVLGVALVFRDVTKQRTAQQAQARLAAIVEFSGDAIVTKNLNGVIQT